MTISEEKPPICDHCGNEKEWKKDIRRKSGGTWRCMQLRRETERAYNKTPKGKARRKNGDKKYRASERGKQKRREQQRRYIRSENGRKVRKAYEETPKFYVMKRKYLLGKMRKKIVNKLQELENGR
jgi:hypothetical protein